jgi:hypothetical protein
VGEETVETVVLLGFFVERGEIVGIGATPS